MKATGIGAAFWVGFAQGILYAGSETVHVCLCMV